MDKQDPFEKYIYQNVTIQLEQKSIVKPFQGYTVPWFTQQPNRNHFENRPQGATIKVLVMHYTVDLLLESLEIFTRDTLENRVSCHYLITQQEPYVPPGIILQVVSEDKQAWHAGVSAWRELQSLNALSLGIENVNQGLLEDGTWAPYDPIQQHALGLLAQKLVRKYQIAPPYVVAHADIAPLRKEDPGPLFPWETLYTLYGVGAWLAQEEQTPEAIQQKYHPSDPLPKEVDIRFLSRHLKAYGYPLHETDDPEDELFKATLTAFQAHFSHNQKPADAHGEPDKTDMFWAWGLCAKYQT